MVMITIMGNLIGRPPKYKTAEELELKCDEYIKICDEEKEPYTIPGLAYYLGYESRFSIFDLKHKKKFSHTIKRVIDKIESQRVSKMLKGSHNVAGCIFDLKNNFGYKDKIEQEISGPGGGPIALTAIPPTPQSLAQWEAMMLESRKAKQIPEKT